MRSLPVIFLRLFALTCVASLPFAAQAAPGDVYVSTDDGAGIGSIIKIRPDGTKIVFATGFQNPQGLAFEHAGNLIVAATTGESNPAGVVLEISPTGSQRVLASIGSAPRGLTYDVVGNLYVADGNCNCIQRIAPDGTQTVYGDGLDGPTGIGFTADGNLFVSNGATEVATISPNGTKTTYASDLASPNGLAVWRAGYLYVVSTDDNAVYAFNLFHGTRSTLTSGFPAAPLSVALDGDDNLLVSLRNGSIYKVSSDGTQTLFASGLNNVSYLAIEPQPVGIEAIGNRRTGKVLVHGHAVTNAFTRVQASNTPDSESFVTIATVFCGPSNRFVAEDINDPPALMRFYRLVYP